MPSGDEFAQIYNEYYPKILRYLERTLGSGDAEDVAQEVFDRISAGISGFQGKSKLSTWIYRIATNAAIDRTRTAAYRYERETVSIVDGAETDLQAAATIPESAATDKLVIQKEMRECINEYIAGLPPDYRTVIVLSELEGMSNREIADILDISLDNAKIRLHRARTRLKAVLRDACEFYYTDENTLACDRRQVRILPKVPK